MFHIGRAFQTLGVVIILYGFIGGGLFFPVFNLNLTSTFRETFPLGALIFLLGLAISKKIVFHQGVVLFSPLILILSNHQFSGKTFFAHYFYIAELVLFISLLMICKPDLKKVTPVVLVIGLIGISYNFFFLLKDTIIFSDDLPSFLYRAIILREANPIFPSWDPFWNGGTLTTGIYASAALTLLPFSSFIDTFLSFNTIVWFIVVVLPIGVSVVALRLLGVSSVSFGIILTLASSTIYYRWALKYGTLGYVLSSHATLLALLVLTKIISSENSAKYKAIFNALVFVAAFWPLNLLNLLIPLMFGILNRKIIFKDLTILSTILLIPFGLTFFGLSHSEKFLTWLSSPIDSGLPTVPQSLKELTRETLLNFNPVITFIGIFSLIKSNISLQVSALNYFLVTFLLGFYFPKLELVRVSGHFAMFLGIIVAAKYTKFIERLRGVPNYFLISLVTVGIIQSAGIFSNQSFEKFALLEKPYKRFIDWAKNQSHCKFMFLGHILHNFSGGHIYPLPFFTGKEFWSAYPFHSSWRPREIVPESAKTSKLVLAQFLDFLEVKYVITDRRFWKRKLSRKFKRVYQFDNFSVYLIKPLNKRKYEPSLNSIRFQLDSNTTNLLIPYIYSKILKVKGCDGLSFKNLWGYNFIVLKNCQAGEVIIFNKYHK